jgi:hypothetical protein
MRCLSELTFQVTTRIAPHRIEEQALDSLRFTR